MKTLPRLIRLSLYASVFLGAGACSPRTASPATAEAGHSLTMPHAGSTAVAPKLEFTSYKPYPYPFSTCVVCGMKLDQAAITFVQGDYEVKVCSPADAEAFKKTPDVYLAKIKLAYQDAKPNPLTTCVVCEMKIDGGFLPFVYDGRQIQVCDKDCLAEFEKDPAKYAKIWDDAAKAAAASKK